MEPGSKGQWLQTEMGFSDRIVKNNISIKIIKHWQIAQWGSRRFSRPNWTKPCTTTHEVRADPALSRRLETSQGPFPPELSYLVMLPINMDFGVSEAQRGLSLHSLCDSTSKWEQKKGLSCDCTELGGSGKFCHSHFFHKQLPLACLTASPWGSAGRVSGVVLHDAANPALKPS